MDAPKKYESIHHVVAVAGFLLDVLVLLALVWFGWSMRIRSLAESVARSEWLVVLIYVIIVGTILKFIQLPLDLYSSYIVEHRFGLSRQSIAAWMKDQLKGLAVGVPLGIAAIELVYYLFRAYPENWWIYASLAFVLFVVAMTNLAPVLLLPLFFKFKPVENEDLRDRVNRLSERTGAHVRGIFEWSLGEKTRKANAAVIGWGNTRRIIVSDTLLEKFSGEEIEVIMAHELCHHVKNHVWQAMTLQSLFTFGAFYAIHRTLPGFSQISGFRGPSDIANFPILVLGTMALSLLALPGVNYFSRRLEMAADRYALDKTDNTRAFVSSMEKLADLNLANRKPNKIIEFIFYSHPSIENRIKLAADHTGQDVTKRFRIESTRPIHRP